MLPSRAALASVITCRWLSLAGEGKLWAFTTSVQIHKYIQYPKQTQRTSRFNQCFFSHDDTSVSLAGAGGLHTLYLFMSISQNWICMPSSFNAVFLYGNSAGKYLRDVVSAANAASAPHCKFTANPQKIKSRRYLINCELRDKWRIKGHNWCVIKKVYWW